jgi:hypothetical protein
MSQPAIDIDRGVSMRQVVRFHKDNPHKFEADPLYGGMTVYMYKDTPGVYYDVHGRNVPEGMAAKAGFDVSKMAKMRRKREAMADFERQMAQALAMEDSEEEILATKGSWKVVGMPMNRAKVVDIETNEAVTPVPMPREDALILLAALNETDESLSETKTKQAKGADKSGSQT